MLRLMAIRVTILSVFSINSLLIFINSSEITLSEGVLNIGFCILVVFNLSAKLINPVEKKDALTRQFTEINKILLTLLFV